MYRRLEEITPLVTGRKILHIYHRLEKITPLVTGRKILHIYITDWKKLRR